jgi:hypothetical protein
MNNIITRKCAKCKGVIEIDVDDIKDVVYFNGVYYHHDCFVEKAIKCSQSKRKTTTDWQYVLKHISDIEDETKLFLRQYIGKEELNKWLLQHYDVSVVPSYFWQLISGLRNGEYRSKKCKPIIADTLYAMWRWGQKNLDKIAANNRNKNKGPKNSSDRLRYDLAVLLTHTDDYNNYITRTKEEAAEIATRTEQANKFDYTKIYQQSKQEKQSDNILDLMNDIF